MNEGTVNESIHNESIHAASAPKAVGHYPHARRVGDLLFLSGIGPRDPASNGIPGNVHDADERLIAYDIAAQTHAVFANVRAVLEASGNIREETIAGVAETGVDYISVGALTHSYKSLDLSLKAERVSG